MAKAMAHLNSSMTGLSLSSGFSSSCLMGATFAPHSPSTSSSSSSKAKFSQSSSIVTMTLRKWELKKLMVKKKLHVRIGDTVKVIAGSDKGKIGEVTRLYPKWGKVMVSDVNVKTKHVRPEQKGETGKIIQMEAPIHSSNVMIYSTTANVASRVGHKLLEDGTKVRYLLKTGEVLDSLERWRNLRYKNKKDPNVEEDSNNT